MEKFRFRYAHLSREELAACGVKIYNPDEETPEYKIGMEINLQVEQVLSRIHLAQENQAIDDEEAASEMDYFQKCIDAYCGGDEINSDLNTSTLIKYASTLGGILRINIEFEDGSKAELL